MIPQRLALVCAWLAITYSGLAQNRTFTSQYSFGDSLSDSGNLFAVARQPPAPYVNGRFSNGPVFTELLGNPIVPAATVAAPRGNLNFAFGGATVQAPGPVPTLVQQIGMYRQLGLAARPTDLFTVLAGANDLIPALAAAAANPALLDTAGANLGAQVAQGVQTLVSLGARNIAVAGMPNLGATPRALLSGGPGGAGSILGLRATTAFNNELRSRLQSIAASTPDLNLLYVDLQGFLDFVVQEHRNLGYNNATSFFLAPATQGGGQGDPNGYVFFDDIHPTARTHALLASVITEQLNPEGPVGFAGALGTATLALQGVATNAVDQRTSQVAGVARAAGRGDVYSNFNYVDGNRDGQGSRPKFNFDAQVVTAGVDYQLTDGLLLGAAVTGGKMAAELSGRRGEFQVEDGAGHLYGIWRGGPVALVLDGRYGVTRLKNIRRTTALGGFATRGKSSGDVWGVGGKAIWNVDLGGAGIRPWLGLRTTRVELDRFTESNVPALGMAFGAQEAESTTGSVGVDALVNAKFGACPVRLDGRVAWHGEIGSDTRSVTGQLSNNITRPTNLAIEDGDGDGFEVGGVATVFLSKKWSLSIGYTADIRTDDRLAHRGMLAVQTGF